MTRGSRPAVIDLGARHQSSLPAPAFRFGRKCSFLHSRRVRRNAVLHQLRDEGAVGGADMGVAKKTIMVSADGGSGGRPASAMTKSKGR
jgi:hypothetical protein